ncbi:MULTISPECIES: flagellin N-terminal helical domain-containing protein [unclassified Paracoccus (in: a-proteobacteria)]|uniref:flagellin N-terminal helical domain-containing protein n=1 Tax=unclassified Paracoccus (in: a-proteobacteria) TaxID=2688777 RepID=UPI0012B3E8C3|nr:MULTISPECIES: flagellin [unclassified Paracoccus (in: a-proteobacteria)]UXU76262.1 flagellin [Paracoccus sp. SMMA_5]UXU81260.1 flagellin [Paracoccus sp. SMMA_5_TC]
MSSILTNNSAMVALQTLKGINANLAKTQDEISTGKKVATAQDNAAVWAISKVMESDESAFKAVQSNLKLAEAVVATARSGAEEIQKRLVEMKNLAIGAGSDANDFGTINDQIVSLKNQITQIIDGSQMNGVNLLKTNPVPGQTTFTVLASLDRTSGTVQTSKNSITINSADFETDIEGATITTITDSTTAQTAIGEIEDLLDIVNTQAAALGTAAKQINQQSDFVSKLADSLKSGIGALVDADMEEASARLQALQTQQQLGVQALSIANQAPQTILSLFK